MAPQPLLAYYAVLAVALFPCSSFALASPKVVSFDLQRREVFIDDAPEHPLRRRANTVGATLYNAQSNLLYLVNATIGTPGQQFSLQLDTGSSDIWIPWVRSLACSQKGRCITGAYDAAASSTFADVAEDQFTISYVDKTRIEGDYINETFAIGGATLKDMTMGLAKASSEQDTTSPFQGIVGVGFDTGEPLYAQTGITYPNVVSQFKAQGFIATRAYSLWLNDRESNSGNMLFGGIDYSKFNGDLTILPLQSDTRGGGVSSFTVVLDNFNVVGANKKVQYASNLTIPVILDSGTTLTYLPDSIANAIATGVGAVSNANYGVVVPCDVTNSPATFNFQFGNANGPTIISEISQFVLPFPANIPTPRFRNGKVACRWGILPSGENPNLFGDTFLRSAYVVYNIDGAQVGIAQTNFNVTKEDIREISATSSLPGATSTASGAAQQTHSGAIYLTGGGGGLAGATATAVETATGTFDLGSSTATSTGQGGGKKGAAGHVQPPSKSFISAIAFASIAFFAMAGGSMVIFI
ncbi:acid protease [Tothia fuscella]|uniref:Acid protease n=1 Tax=Tothia fuscella TaxID=1048955 RepID=A0A9P4TVU2_9PEZI|nr:acid protease [Tothia fuscella]